MIEWLRQSDDPPQIELSGRALPIDLRRHPTARRLTLRLAPDGSAVRITMPKWCASRDALAFVRARRGWLETQLAKVPAPRDPIGEGCIDYRGRALGLAWDETAPRTVRIAGDRLEIGGPQDTLAPRLQRWLKRQALTLFEQDAAFYCERAGLPVARVRVSNATRRWGSCSSKGVLRLNWRLVQAPDPIRRSVVAHEVAHLVHFDHSPAFHSLLARIYEGDMRAADAWLKSDGRTLYASFG